MKFKFSVGMSVTSPSDIFCLITIKYSKRETGEGTTVYVSGIGFHRRSATLNINR